MAMETWSNGWTKTCSICGGPVKFIENTGEAQGCEWLLYCLSCDTNLYEEDVIFKEGDKG